MVINFLLFCGGLLTQTKVEIGGELFLVHVYLLGLLGIMTLTGQVSALLRKRDATTFLILNLLTIFAYLMSDLIQGTDIILALKGWIKPIFLMIDWLALGAATMLRPKRMGWFLLGRVIGTTVVILFFKPELVFFEKWKLGMGGAIGTFAMMSNAVLPFLGFLAATVAHSIFSFTLDSRSLGAIAILSATLSIFVRFFNGRAGFISRNFTLIAGAGLSLIIIGNMLHQNMKTDYDRRAESDIGRKAGIISALYAIERSPLIGYGSSPNQHALSAIFRDVLNSELRKNKMKTITINNMIFNPHSKTLQIWVESGIIGAALFLFLALRVGQGFLIAVNHRPYDWFTPVLIYSFIDGMWSLFMSPFAAGTVIGSSIVITLCIMIRNEDITNIEQTQPPANGLNITHGR